MSERRLALALLLLVLAINAAVLAPELRTGRLLANDANLHFSLLDGMVHAIETGGNPLDFWSPGISFGSAPIRTYQPLAHLVTAASYFALGKTVPLLTVFLWMRYLAVVLLPAAFFYAALQLELTSLTAAFAALLAPLISTDGWYGLDYGSYISNGRGLFPQSLAAILLLCAIGAGYQALRRGRRVAFAGLLLGLTCVCHFIYGWIGAVTLCLLALLPDPDTPRRLRIRRTLWVGAVSFVLSAFQLLPVWQDRAILNHSRLEGAWKWDSFGAGIILKALFTGELLDHDRLPVLTLLALSGAALLLWKFYRTRRLPAAEAFLLAAAVFWILVFFGRPTWGPLLLLLGVLSDLHLHRVIGAVHIFLVLLAALAIESAWRSLKRRGGVVLAVLCMTIVLAPMLLERAAYLEGSTAQAAAQLMAVDAERPALESCLGNLRQAGGRVYAGSTRTWGPRFEIGGMTFAAFLNMHSVPQASDTYHNIALTADLFPLFEEDNPAWYRLFNVRSVVTPAALNGLPDFLTPRAAFGAERTYDAPGKGYFDIVDVTARVPIDRDSFLPVNQQWLLSGGMPKRAHLLLDLSGQPGTTLPAPPTPAGEIQSEHQTGQDYAAEFSVSRPAYVLFRMTWHPNWVAWFNGKPQPTRMLSPGFIAVPVTPGQTRILLRYQPGIAKPVLALAGVLVALLALAAEHNSRCL